MPDLHDLRTLTPDAASQALYRARKRLAVHAPAGPVATRRTAQHGRHDIVIRIVIRTTYDIRIDGRRVGGHLKLGNDGRVHYHGLPAYGGEE
jgi:hypothetical protein